LGNQIQIYSILQDYIKFIHNNKIKSFIFFKARRLLGEQGVMIVKDSSANKAGVCCSSYEIVASMLLAKEEFMDIKEELVEDVLERLREIGTRNLFLSEHRWEFDTCVFYFLEIHLFFRNTISRLIKKIPFFEVQFYPNQAREGTFFSNNPLCNRKFF